MNVFACIGVMIIYIPGVVIFLKVARTGKG